MFLKKLKIELPNDSANPLLDIYPQGGKWAALDLQRDDEGE